MRSLSLLLAVVVGSGLVTSASGQDKPPAMVPVPPIQASAAEKKFDELVHKAAKLLQSGSAYSVEAVCEWKGSGNGPERTGKNVLTIVAEGTNRLRLEAIAEGRDKQGQLLVVSDGKTLTRMFTGHKLYSQTPTTRPLDDLQTDNLTRQALRGSGMDFLLKTDLVGHVLAQTSRVTDLGIVESRDQKLQAFKLNLADGREVVVHMTTGDHPIPVEIFTTVRVPLAENKTFVLNLDTRLKWNLKATPTADTFVARIPEGARKVNDLMEAIVQGDVVSLLGKPVPALSLTTLDGQKVNLADHKGKVVVLYFWATWAAPSITDMPGLNRFVEAYTARGATIYAVAVGDKSTDVSAFAQKEGYKGPMLLDPRAESLASLKTNALPAVLIIGKDGTLQAYHRGARPNLRDQIRQDLDQLLKGEQLVPKE